MKTGTGISSLKGVGEKTEKLFSKIGVRTVGDLLSLYPRGYELYEPPVAIAEAEEGRTVTISGAIYGRVQTGGSRNRQITSLYIKDLTGTLKVIWFRMPFLKNTLAKGGAITVRGRIVRRAGQLLMEHPELFYPASSYEKKLDTMQPVYPLTAGLTNNAVSKAVRQALSYLDSEEEFLPEDIREKYDLQGYTEAVCEMHFPKEKASFYHARKRLVFDEFLIFILSLRSMQKNRERAANQFVFRACPQIDKFIRALPYELTKAQQKVWDEIRSDLEGQHVMSRLVQGDVGSGKTIVAVLGLFSAALNGYQGALMAPTEVLARQHYANITKLILEYGFDFRAELLTGSMSAKEKREAYERIASGASSVIIGTHALIQEKVSYQNLAFVVTDEQHRFGVRQREALAGKSGLPHILVMSATPIPRTLAIILYGDLDISIINELPKNRLPIKNCVVGTGYRETAYNFMKKQISEGRQCYIICPMVEESESLEAENVQDYAEQLKQVMGKSIQVGVLHGRMKPAEKDAIMGEFADNQIQILVSTTVVEVGIDVPNATVIMIENAERFGLAQLHQLRGRVGRGKHQSYCIFMTPSKAKETKERLEILNHSNDGFYIAGEDLRLRGPGDLFGIRQSGILDFKVADVFQDAEVLKQASEAADTIIKESPALEKETYAKLKKRLNQYLSEMELEKTL